MEATRASEHCRDQFSDARTGALRQTGQKNGGKIALAQGWLVVHSKKGEIPHLVLVKSGKNWGICTLEKRCIEWAREIDESQAARRPHWGGWKGADLFSAEVGRQDNSDRMMMEKGIEKKAK